MSELLDSAIDWVMAELEWARAPSDAAPPSPAAACFEGCLARDVRVAALSKLGLSMSEQKIVMLLAVLELDADAAALFQQLHPAGASTLALKARVYGSRASELAFRELGPTGVLRRLAIIERSDGNREDVPESRRTWALARRIVGLLHGDSSIDASLAGIVRALDPPAIETLAVDNTTRRDALEACRPGSLVVVASGTLGLGRATLLAAASRKHGLDVLEIDARRVTRDAVRAIARECRLLARVPLIAGLDALDNERRAVLAGELLPLLDGLVLATCGAQRPAIDWGRPLIIIELAQPSCSQRSRLWVDAVGNDAFADLYPLAPALIRRVGDAARARARERDVTTEDIRAAIRAVVDNELGRHARRVRVTQTWDDLVLPPDQCDTIIELIARVRERRRVYETWGFGAKVGKGLGVSALFSGPPGTGKTMVAALIARELELELYQVDLARVVSKWVGETEKNLGAVFDAAEACHAVLLFDEADALFGKRSDVRSSNDRYANLETDYLLQRLESFTGICILTSNHETAIDPAFMRRLSVHLRFEFPDEEERALLWRAMLPPDAPLACDVDVAALARRFALSGGYIRNAVLRAAFLAAEQNCAIAMVHLERAARLECEGIGRLAA